MSGLLKDVSDTVKAGARDLALAASLGLGAAILGAIAIVFLAYAGYSALHLAMPAWAAALIIALVLLTIAIILALFMRSAAQTVGDTNPENDMPSAEIVPPWAAYGIPKEVPVDKILQQAKAAGLSLLGRMTARYSMQTILPALVPLGVGLVGYIAARRVSHRLGERRLPHPDIRRR